MLSAGDASFGLSPFCNAVNSGQVQMTSNTLMGRAKNPEATAARAARLLARPYVKKVAIWQVALANIRALQGRDERGQRTRFDWRQDARDLLAIVDEEGPLIEEFVAGLTPETARTPAVADLKAALREALFRVERLRTDLMI